MKAIEALFPKARGEILRILFTGEGTELYLREIVRRSSLTLRAMQKELANLVEAGLVLSRRDGNRVYFQANPANPVYPELCGIARKNSGMVDLLKAALREVPGIEVAFIFGSVAAGTETPESDVDLFVIGSIGLRQLVPLLRPVSEQISREVNPYNLTVETWQERLRSGDALSIGVASRAKIFIKGSSDDLERLAP